MSIFSLKELPKKACRISRLPDTVTVLQFRDHSILESKYFGTRVKVPLVQGEEEDYRDFLRRIRVFLRLPAFIA
jgi:hypothetical protein